MLRQWKVQQGLSATYRALLKVCCEGGDHSTAETICKVLREKASEASKDGMWRRTLTRRYMYGGVQCVIVL